MNEIPEINSELRWDQVSLPPAVSETDLDGLILSVMSPYWQKMAMALGTAVGRCRELGWPISKEALAARIHVLVESDRLEGAGDLRIWRHSEVRLKD
jgi:hypothetical protein